MTAYRSAPLRELGRVCPRCGSAGKPLVARKLSGLDVLECPGCWGTWMSTGEHRRASQSRQLQEILAALPVVSRPPRAEGTPRCPVCDKAMRRRAFRKRSGVTIDECERHGVWFDVDELRRAFGFALTQTVARAKRRPEKPVVDERPPVKIPVGGPSGEATLRQAVRLLWKALFGELLDEPKSLVRSLKKKPPTSR